MKKIFLTSAICMCIAAPTYANIASDAENPTCDNATIGATSGDTNMEAIWGANTINLVYTADGQTFTPTNSTANTCTYDQHVVIPTNIPSKLGYTFDGWRVKPFSLSGLDISINGIDYGYKNDSRSEYGAASYNTDTYGLTADNTWATEFSYGTVYGEASCQATLDADMAYYLTNVSAALDGTMPVEDFRAGYANVAGAAKTATLQDIFTRYSNGQITLDEASVEINAKLMSGNDSKYTTSTSGQYCFCRATGYTPLNGTRQNVASPAWVFYSDHGSAYDCASYCADDCAFDVQGDPVLRSGLFGSSN